MELTEVDRLLDPAPLPLEMGVKRLDSGVLHIATRTDMYGCKGRMFEWWFRFAPDTRQYFWWHPIDHVSSEWVETSPTTHVGSSHIVRERLSSSEEIHDLTINFRDPTETFSADALAEAREAGWVSGLVCAHTGFGHEPPRDDQRRPIGGRMVHMARDTDWGMVLRTRFWLGAGVDAPPEVLTEMIPESLGLQLMQHAYTEFRYLGEVVPPLYRAEEREAEAPVLPW